LTKTFIYGKTFAKFLKKKYKKKKKKKTLLRLAHARPKRVGQVKGLLKLG
jgi:hypothetical protein